MKKQLLFCLWMVLSLSYTFAFAQQKQKFSIVSFEQDSFDLSAKDKQYEKVDGSGARYAIIKVTSTNPDDNLGEYRFNFGNLRSSTVEKDGVLWVYVQKNAKMVTISRNGYATVNKYDLQTTIEAGKNYKMQLSSAGKVVYTQMVQFNVKPLDTKAVIMIKSSNKDAQEELFGTVDATGAAAKSLEYGVYTYKVVSDNYHTTEGRITLNDKSKTYVETVTLRPNFSEMTFTVDADADIYINNEKKGTRTWRGTLKAGNYQVECRQANHRTSTQYISVADNDNRAIKLNAPEPIEGTIAITSVPLGANITIDGRDYGQTPRNIDIIVGQHDIILSKADYQSKRQSVEVRENQTSNVNMTLGNYAKMTISSKPNGADLYIDGKYVGETPYTTDIASGDYTIKLTHNKYHNFEKRVHLDSSNPNISYTLVGQMYQPSQMYIEAIGQFGMANGVGANIGGHFKNFNAEVSYTKILGSEQFYYNSTSSTSLDVSGYSIGAKVGYGIIVGPKLRVTPQVGAKMLYLNGQDNLSDDVCATIGCRVEYAIASHFGVSLTPEYSLAVSKDDTAKELTEVSSKIKGWLSGIYLRVGLNVYF